MGPRQKCLGNTPEQMAEYALWPASMGPRQKCLGNISFGAILDSHYNCFNGAETKMSRKSVIPNYYGG